MHTITLTADLFNRHIITQVAKFLHWQKLVLLASILADKVLQITVTTHTYNLLQSTSSK